MFEDIKRDTIRISAICEGLSENDHSQIRGMKGLLNQYGYHFDFRLILIDGSTNYEIDAIVYPETYHEYGEEQCVNRFICAMNQFLSVALININVANVRYYGSLDTKKDTIFDMDFSKSLKGDIINKYNIKGGIISPVGDINEKAQRIYNIIAAHFKDNTTTDDTDLPSTIYNILLSAEQNDENKYVLLSKVTSTIIDACNKMLSKDNALTGEDISNIFLIILGDKSKEV